LDIKTRILKESEALFKRAGVRSITMDDIANQLGISKKTLYQHFENKAAIVHEYGKRHFAEEMAQNERYNIEAKDPIHAVVLVLEASAKTFRDMPSHLMFDIQKYYPETWQLFEAFKNDYALRAIRDNLIAGQQAGLYRQDFDVELMAHMRLSQIDAAFNPQFFPPDKFDIGQVQIAQFLHYLHGIVSLKGKHLLYQYLQLSEDA
jgi:TetR/AcrR family transcriptional regulator, cholesterol catabolism regulator